MSHPDFITIGHITHDLVNGGTIVGGSSLYSGIMAKRLGKKVGVVTCVGQDFHHWEVLEETEVVYSLAPSTTTFANIYLDGTRQQSILKVADPIHSQIIPPTWYNAEIVHICPVANEVSLDTVGLFKGSLIGVTPQGWMRKWDSRGEIKAKKWEQAGDILRFAQVLILSEDDILGDEGRIYEYLKLVEVLILTRGKKGAVLYYHQNHYHIPAFRTIVLDQTGAGDVFASAFLIRYSQTKDPLRSAEFATCAASFVIEKQGIEGVPNFEDIIRRKEIYRKRYGES